MTALSAARRSAVWAKSMPVTCQPCCASQIASPPSPQPASSAVRGGSDDISATNCGLAFPLHSASCD
ncbi:Uncharacterised protein [Mycobacteroides abscessus subsp. abscessus]|nr:Uncharacterised protein [Mycobacteroides abscessus subsp. abscessus]